MSTTNTFGSETRRDAKARERHKARSARKPNERKAFAEAVTGVEIADRVVSRFSTGSILLSEIEDRAHEDIRQALERVEGEVDGALRPKLRAWRELKSSFIRFCAEQGIEPVLEPDGDPVRKNLIIGMVLVIEWVAAGMFYGAHLAQPVMGLAWALMPIFFTFATSYGCALSARRIDRTNRRRTIEAAGGMALFGVLGLAGLLVAAHLRDRFEAEQTGALTTALIDDVLGGPLDLSNAGWLLLLGSFAAFLFLVHHLYQGREKVPGLTARTRALAEATKGIDEEFRRIDECMDIAINGTIDRAAARIERCRREVSEALQVIRGDLQRHGIVDPENVAETNPENKPLNLLIDKWKQLRRLHQSVFGVGNLYVTLHQLPFADGQSISATSANAPPRSAPVHRAHLTDCRRLDEARLWLESELASFDFEVKTEDAEGSRDA